MIFAAGNLGDTVRSSCTIYSPAIAKNVLAIGATSSGETRLTTTADVGDIDTVASFSSYGPTSDGRIKPELVAPGDMVRSYFYVFLLCFFLQRAKTRHRGQAWECNQEFVVAE